MRVISFIPMFMFAVLFGLSMEYEVFLLSRVREEYLAKPTGGCPPGWTGSCPGSTSGSGRPRLTGGKGAGPGRLTGLQWARR